MRIGKIGVRVCEVLSSCTDTTNVNRASFMTPPFSTEVGAAQANTDDIVLAGVTNLCVVNITAGVLDTSFFT